MNIQLKPTVLLLITIGGWRNKAAERERERERTRKQQQNEKKRVLFSFNLGSERFRLSV